MYGRAEQGTTGCAPAPVSCGDTLGGGRAVTTPKPRHPAKLGVERSNDHQLACAARRMSNHEITPAGTDDTDPKGLRHRLCAWRGAIRFPLDEMARRSH